MPIKNQNKEGSNGIPEQPIDDKELLKKEVNGAELDEEEKPEVIVDKSKKIAEAELRDKPPTIDDVSKLDDTGTYVLPVLMRGSMIKDIDKLRERGDYTDEGEVVRDLMRYGLRRIQSPKSNDV